VRPGLLRRKGKEMERSGGTEGTGPLSHMSGHGAVEADNLQRKSCCSPENRSTQTSRHDIVFFNGPD